jgi:four helix bundle protein
MDASHFRDLACWQLANELRTAVYAATATSTVAPDRDFCDDIRRAARSAPAQIAEGFARGSRSEFARHVSVARAALFEVEHHLLHLLEVGALSPADWTRLADLTQRTQRACSAARSQVFQA